MKIPDFKNDAEMAEWFEANDVGAEDLEPADDVVIADDLAVSVVKVFGSVGLFTVGVGSSAPTVTGDRTPDLIPVG